MYYLHVENRKSVVTLVLLKQCVFVYFFSKHFNWYLKLFQLAEIVSQGKLVSDEIIFDLLSKRLQAGEAKGESGFILDGFPRTIRQAVRPLLYKKISLLLNIMIPIVWMLNYRVLVKYLHVDSPGYLQEIRIFYFLQLYLQMSWYD